MTRLVNNLLESEFRTTRQGAITGELLDIVSGVEAIVGGMKERCLDFDRSGHTVAVLAGKY
ncbi:MAG TPA: hypothetical protein DCR95_02495 [Desulfobacter sp.]|nr:hypothetical protein [Desulfobacter sp.]